MGAGRCAALWAWQDHHHGRSRRGWRRHHGRACDTQRLGALPHSTARRTDRGCRAMMPMSQLGPWFTRLIIVMFIFAAYSAAPTFALCLVIGSAIAALSVYLYQGRYLPRFIMDVLDRLTNRTALEDAYQHNTKQLLSMH